MARVIFSALVESITGKLAGSVFQDSYQGYQIRTRVSPKNPQTDYQQLRRGEFAFLSQGWRYLSSTERQTWIDNAPAGMQALNFYLQSNINLVLIGLAPVASYAADSTPSSFPLAIPTLGSGVLTVEASGSSSSVPADTKLLLQATYEKPPTRIFTNPSQYGPIVSFDEGTDLSSPVDISTDWIARYGQFTSAKRICLKSNLISKINGGRSTDEIVCANEAPTPTEMIYLAKLTQSGTSAPVATVLANTSGLIITFSRSSTGLYMANIGGTFDPAKLSGGTGQVTSPAQVTTRPFLSLPAFVISTYSDFLTTPADGILSDTEFSIVVDDY